MKPLVRALIGLLFLGTWASAESRPFVITASSNNATLNGMKAYVPSSNTFDALLLFTSDPGITITNFTLDNSGGHFEAHNVSPFLEAYIDNTGYDENVFFGTVDAVSSFGGNPILCHEYTNYISCSVTSEGNTRLSKTYVCQAGTFGHYGGLMIGNAVPSGCAAVQLNFTNVE